MYQLSDIIVVKEISYNTFLNKKNPEIGIYEIYKSVLLPENIDAYIKKHDLVKVIN